MYHLGAGIGLLVVVGDGHTIEFCLRSIATQHARGVLPCDGRARLYLCPRELRVDAPELSTLGDEVEHTTFTILIARIPVLHGGVFHLGSVLHNDFHDGGMELVFVAHRCGTAFEIAHIGIVVGYDKGAFKLSCVACIDAEIAAQLHRTAHTFGYIDERPVSEHGAVEGCN